MEHASRPLTKRPRASLACNACRQTKSKVSPEMRFLGVAPAPLTHS